MWHSIALVLALLSTTTANASNSFRMPKALVGGGIALTKVEVAALENARICHVRHVLNQRVELVLSGARQREFTKWAKKGNVTIFSMHGSEELDLDFVAAETLIASDDMIFPDDKLNLDLVPVATLPSLYPGKQQHLMDRQAPSVVELLLRSLHLGLIFTPIISTSILALLFPSFRELFWYKWVANCLAASGPAFIKWGQWASTRSDMYPDTLCLNLAQLHSDAPSHSWDHTQKMVESSLGLPRGTLLEVFDSFDAKPVASGSIAQVHKAVLRAENAHLGTIVAVKVRHPNVAKLIDMDFRLMKVLASMADCIPALSWLHIRDSVEQFSYTMAAQAHLNVEGHHLEVLNYNFRSWHHINFPRPIYASSCVIVETFEPGRIVTEVLDTYDAMAKQVILSEHGTLTVEEVDDIYNADKTEGIGSHFVPINVAKFIVTNGLALYLKMLLVDNLMHADLHPGNIMLDLDHREKKAHTPVASTHLVPPMDNRDVRTEDMGICLVDAGMVAKLTKEESTNFIGLLCSMGEGNGRLAAQFALRFSVDTNLTQEQRQAFINDMDRVFQEQCGGYGTDVDVGNVMRSVLGLIRTHRVRIDANYATLVVNCLCVESLAKRVCPNYSLLDAARPLLQLYQGLCYGRNGTVNENPSAVQKALVRMRMPLAYISKGALDSSFFGKEREKQMKLRQINLKLQMK